MVAVRKDHAAAVCRRSFTLLTSRRVHPPRMRPRRCLTRKDEPLGFILSPRGFFTERRAKPLRSAKDIE